MKQEIAHCVLPPGDVAGSLAFIKEMRFTLRELRKIRVYPARIELFDVNQDWVTVDSVGYTDPNIHALLAAVGTAYDPQKIHEPTTEPYKEFLTGRRHPWAEDRAM